MKIAKGRNTLANAFDFSKEPDDLTQDEADLLRRRKNVLGTLGPLFYDHPIHVVRGSEAHLFDAAGTDYLDCYNNVACVGHANEHVREAVADQLAKQDTHSRYLQDEIIDYAERLLGYFTPAYGSVANPHLCGFDRVSFTNSGSESNDLALRMARVYTGAQGVVVTDYAYHGITSLVSSVSPNFGTGVPLAPFLATVRVSDVLSGLSTGAMGDEDVTRILLQRFEEAFEKLHNGGFGVSAVLLDQIFSSDGVLPGNAGWVAAVAQATHDAGGLLIADEVQSGFARTGEAFWGFQRHHADADIVSMGKPMGNGIPVGAVVYKSPIGDALASCTRYFNTFGGNPVSMRAAGAVLDEIEHRDLLRHAKAMGDRICADMEALLGETPRFLMTRHAGLFIGIDIGAADGSGVPDALGARKIISALRDRNILISASGASGSSLKLRPPLVFSDADEDRLMQAVADMKKEGLFG